MANEIEIIRDETGEERRLGSLVLPEGFVRSRKTFEALFAVDDDATIKQKLKGRRPRRSIFTNKWQANQGQWGSCNGWAGALGLSKTRRLVGIRDGMLLSGSYVYSKINGGRDQGSMLDDGMAALERYGAPSATLVTPSMIYPHLLPRGADEEAAKHKGIVCFPCETIQGLRTGMANGLISIVAVHVGRNFQRLNSDEISGVDSGRGNHAVHCDDMYWDGGRFIYDEHNTWGLQFGVNGRSRLTEEHFADTFYYHEFYLIGSVQEAA